MAKTAFHIPLAYQNRMFGYYLGQIEQQRRLLQHVRQSLPENLAKHVCHCLASNNTLLVYTDSAIWASQLRFYNQTLLAAMLSAAAPPTPAVQKVNIKVMTETTGATSQQGGKKPQVNIPSADTIDLMQKQSASISDPTLQQALQRLNATLKKRAERS
jgi:hypothetical protein